MASFPLPQSPATIGQTILRVVLGVTFALHGWQKLNEWTIAGTQAAFAEMGVPLAAVAAPFAAGVEFVGGILLIVGLATRIVAALQVLVVLGALVLVHLAAGFFAADGGIELVLLLAAAALFFALSGAGPLSADHAIAARKNRVGVPA